jgi:hypothetical protein
MPENKNAGIHIGQLNLRLPGTSADAAHGVANRIGQGLGQEVPLGMQRQLGALSVRVQAPAGATEAEMSNAVVVAIIKALRQ